MTLSSTTGYNYIDKSVYGYRIAYKNTIPLILYADEGFRLSIDTSNGTNYSDYTLSHYGIGYGIFHNLYRLNLDLNWRYYFRIYYETETNNTIQFTKNYSSINKEQLKVTAWLNLTNGTSFNSTCLIKTQYQPTTQNDLTTTINNEVKSTETITTQSIITNSETKSLFFSTFSVNQSKTNEITTVNSNKNLSTLIYSKYSWINTTQNEFLTTMAQNNSTKYKSNLVINSSNSLILSEILNELFSIQDFNQINITELFHILENKTFQFDLKSDSYFPTQLLESSDLDINNCISNCSNQGLCKLTNNQKNRNEFECLCNVNFTGSKCELDKRPCSQTPCLNSIKCEDILILQNSSNIFINYDFKCHCKSELFYGKRCESKKNLCQNETCSGNGICQIIRIGNDGLNETIKCECFGQNDFEGEKCQTKTSKTKQRENTIKITAWIAISIIIMFYSLFILMDLHKIITLNTFYSNQISKAAKNKPIN